MDGKVELENKLDAIQKDLKDKEQEIEDQDCLIQALITKERKSNDELLETRKELINVSSVLLSWFFGRRFEWCTPKAHRINHSWMLCPADPRHSSSYTGQISTFKRQ